MAFSAVRTVGKWGEWNFALHEADAVRVNLSFLRSLLLSRIRAKAKSKRAVSLIRKRVVQY